MEKTTEQNVNDYLKKNKKVAKLLSPKENINRAEGMKKKQVSSGEEGKALGKTLDNIGNAIEKGKKEA